PQLGANVSGTLTVPASALNGPTRMRVRLHDTVLGGNAGPCGTSTYGQVEDYTVVITGGSAVCEADAGTLSGGSIVCLENGEATLTATADGNANVPAGYSTVYVLTEGAGLVIVQAGATPEFVVDAEGDYTIHTLVYDPATLDLGIVEFGVTTGFDVNGLLIQGGGEICASLDVAGAAYTVEICPEPCDADAGTLSGGTIVCLENDEATLTATADGNAVVPAGYSTVYVLTEGAGLVIVQAGATPEFVVDAEGDFTIHTLVYDPATLDLGIVEFGVTTGFDVNGLLIQGGGEICASLDVAGTAFEVLDCTGLCLVDAGTLSGGGTVCFEDGAATLTATPDGNAVVLNGYSTVYVLTEGAGLVIVQAGAAPEFIVDAEGDYTIHTLVYDPTTLDLGIVEFGVTTGFDVNGLLIQGGGEICASLDVAGAAYTVEICPEPCLADAGTLSGGDTVCLVDDEATLTATADGNANVPAGYSTVYVLTEGAGLVIVQAGAAPEFIVDAEGDYTIHTLVYDPTTLDLGIVEFGVTTGFDVNGLLIQGGGEICASLDVAGAAYTVEVCVVPCDADAGTLDGGANVCFENNEATLTATADGNAVVPAGYSTVYVLTQGAGLVIVQTAATPEFVVGALGIYTIHTLVYDAATLDLGIVVPGVTTGFDVNGLLIQGGGDICASLDVAGAEFNVQDCTFIGENNGVDVAVFPNPSNGDFAIRYGANGPVAIDIIDVSGRLVYNSQLTATANEVMQVQLGGRLAPGTYILRMSTNEGSDELRIVVQ
ncbi:MAG: GEVED domain-containing protein, partial [Flavobacteriales bacterium]